MKTSKIKTRFCPSPTGFIHLGNTRTALFSDLLARGSDGIFLLRIEDTDQSRSELRYAQTLMEDLRWLGMMWQEGPECEGDRGPYWQSQRAAIYDKFYHQLKELKLVYPCFCSEQQLELNRKIQRAAGKPPRYPGTCRHLSDDQIQHKLAQGLLPTLRFAVPANQEILFIDLVRGEQRFNTNDIGDFIVRRADGTAPFLFCNAIDDALMGVTHALRGDDHLTNTPRQILILQALNLPIPEYGHISLILGHDGTPLSKRHGSRSVQELRQEGYLAIGIINYLARLGHHYAKDSFMTLEELARNFSVNALVKAPARFDINQMLYWQKEAVLRLSDEEFWDWLKEDTKKLVPAAMRDSFVAAVRANCVFPQDASKWAQIFFADTLVMPADVQEILQTTHSDYFSLALSALDQYGADFLAVSDAVKTTLNIKGKALYQPLRVALTGELHGPEMVKIFEILGKEKIRARILAVNHVTNS